MTARDDAQSRQTPASGPAGAVEVPSKAKIDAVMEAARRSGLLDGKGSRIGGRLSPSLIAQAKRKTGIETDTDLLAFALASVALDDEFAEAFAASRGKVDPDIKLGY